MKNFTRLLFISALALMYFSSNAQNPWATATASNQVKEYRKLDSIKIAVQTQTTTQAVNKQKLDTIAQNTRWEVQHLDTINRFITVTTTITCPSGNTLTVVGNACTNSDSQTGSYSISIPSGSWRITGITVSNSFFAGLRIFICRKQITQGPNNTTTSMTTANANEVLGYYTITGAGSTMFNGYVGENVAASSVTSQFGIPVRDYVHFVASYNEAVTVNGLTWVIKFHLSRN